MDQRKALEKAISNLGGQMETARKLSAHLGRNIGQSTVSGWVVRGNGLPEKYMHHIEYLTAMEGKRVPAEILCPDAFPALVPAA